MESYLLFHLILFQFILFYLLFSPLHTSPLHSTSLLSTPLFSSPLYFSLMDIIIYSSNKWFKETWNVNNTIQNMIWYDIFCYIDYTQINLHIPLSRYPRYAKFHFLFYCIIFFYVFDGFSTAVTSFGSRSCQVISYYTILYYVISHHIISYLIHFTIFSSLLLSHLLHNVLQFYPI